jgi:hypothetical protein
MYGSAADYFIYIGSFALIIVLISFLVFLAKRVVWVFGILFGMSVGSPDYKSGTIKFLIYISLLIAVGIFTYSSFYSRAYPQYDEKKPGAEVSLFPGTGDNSLISIDIQRDEKHKTTQGASMPNGQYLLIGETLNAPEWLQSFGVTDGFRISGLIKGSFTGGYNDKAIDINVSEKPNDFIWKMLFAIQEFVPIADIEKHYVQFTSDGFNTNFNVYVSKDGFKRD